MINSPSYGRVFLIISLVTAGVSISACTTHRQANSTAAHATKPVKAAAARPGNRTTVAKRARAAPISQAAAPANAPDVTASIKPAAPPAGSSAADLSKIVAGKTFIYEYAGSRGTITYLPNGTSTYDEPGLRKGRGRWQFHGTEFCQSFSGIKERCVELRQAGRAYYIGGMKLTLADQ
jgi:hypothetical protein